MNVVVRPDGAASAAAGLRALAECGGCAAKAEPGLVALLTGLLASQATNDASVLAGLRWADFGGA